MNSATIQVTRRRMLRGMLGGGAVTVGLPLLDCLLDTNGTAFADTGAPLPPCFGTWFWGLGFAEGSWAPKTTGQDYELPPPLSVLAPFKDRINIFSGMQVFLDGKINSTHFSGVQAIMTGSVTTSPAGYTTSLDTIIGNVISKRTRFQTLVVACDGDPKSSFSARDVNVINPAEVSPVALYTRIFGPGFKDPNAAEFVPSPKVMVRESALSVVVEERQALLRNVGAEDRRRLDQYFSSVRDLEQKLAIELEKPEPLAACTKPNEIKEAPESTLLEDALTRHDLFATLLAHALACGQTQVVNLALSQGMSGFRMEGDTTNHHIYTHEESIDPELGYQPMCDRFARSYMGAFRNFLATLDGIKEGDGTLLDRTLIFAFTDHGEARVHGLLNYPFILAGRAGGRMKTGFHVAALGDSITRVGFTAQQVMGVPTASWGTGSNQVSRPFPELLT